MEDLLPNNVMCNVLSRLPVKTIIRYKCVCKKWCDLVSDPNFVNLHLSRSREALMIFDHYKPSRPGCLMWVEMGYKALVQVKRLDLTDYCGFVAGYWLSQVGSVNGLICSAYHKGFLIYNPVLEECMYVPPPLQEFETLSYGLGVSMVGEYKLIHISHRKISLDSDELYAVEIEVYTLGTGKWRILGQTPFRFKSIKGEVDNGIFVNSHVYWIIHDQIYDFDLNTETFELFPSPPGDSGASNMKMLGVLKGRLSGVSWCWLGLEVWVMKETSWYKERTIKENISHLLDHNSRPLCLINGIDGTLLVFHEDELMAHCLDTNKTLPLNMKMCFDRCRLVTTYRPSFVKLGNFGLESVLADMYEDREESRKEYVHGRWDMFKHKHEFRLA
ncbi:putative F-box domain-containing protein [Helianthus anomalus]